jgi:hypothetical protein
LKVELANLNGKFPILKAATCKTKTTQFATVGLLVLAGAFSDGRFASAQEACSLPAGGTPVAPPRVTAQQVESGTGSLMDFALSARDRFREQAVQATTAGQAQYLGIIRQTSHRQGLVDAAHRRL